eukprot:Rhum_TRINITY_DN3535_c0_g1::Rhum_TRINITY_DN3535_c0_g1_i1::g.11184::m.11184
MHERENPVEERKRTSTDDTFSFLYCVCAFPSLLRPSFLLLLLPVSSLPFPSSLQDTNAEDPSMVHSHRRFQPEHPSHGHQPSACGRVVQRAQGHHRIQLVPVARRRQQHVRPLRSLPRRRRRRAQEVVPRQVPPRHRRHPHEPPRPTQRKAQHERRRGAHERVQVARVRRRRPHRVVRRKPVRVRPSPVRVDERQLRAPPYPRPHLDPAASWDRRRERAGARRNPRSRSRSVPRCVGDEGGRHRRAVAAADVCDVDKVRQPSARAAAAAVGQHIYEARRRLHVDAPHRQRKPRRRRRRRRRRHRHRQLDAAREPTARPRVDRHGRHPRRRPGENEHRLRVAAPATAAAAGLDHPERHRRRHRVHRRKRRAQRERGVSERRRRRRRRAGGSRSAREEHGTRRVRAAAASEGVPRGVRRRVVDGERLGDGVGAGGEAPRAQRVEDHARRHPQPAERAAGGGAGAPPDAPGTARRDEAAEELRRVATPAAALLGGRGGGRVGGRRRRWRRRRRGGHCFFRGRRRGEERGYVCNEVQIL